MKAKLPLIARILLGLIFTVFGAMGLMNAFTPPPELPEPLATFTKGIFAAKYFVPMHKATETICGLLLLSGSYVPLALVVLAPIVLNIFLVHLFLMPQGLILAVIIGVLEIYLAFFSPYSGPIKQLFRKKP